MAEELGEVLSDLGSGTDPTVDAAIDYGSEVLGAAGAVGGVAAADALLAGGAAAAGMGAGAAAAGGAAIAGGVILAGAAGYGIGTKIEEATGIGSATGDAMYNISSEEAHQATLEHYENAEEAWGKGEYGTAIVEGAASVGTMVGGAVEGAASAAGEALEDAGEAIVDFFSGE